MKLNRGCGCLVLGLGLTNVLLFAGGVIGMVNKTTSTGLALLMMAIFAANVAVCLLMGLASLRVGRMSTSTDGGEGGDEGLGEDEAVSGGEDQ